MQPSMRKVTDGAMENPTTTSPSVPVTSDALTSATCFYLRYWSLIVQILKCLESKRTKFYTGGRGQ